MSAARNSGDWPRQSGCVATPPAESYACRSLLKMNFGIALYAVRVMAMAITLVEESKEMIIIVEASTMAAALTALTAT